MVELTNKLINYEVKNQDENLKLSGTIQIAEDKRITTFYGAFYSLQDEFSGSFSYSEEGEDLINSSVTSYPLGLEAKGMTLLDTTLKEIKAKLEEE